MKLVCQRDYEGYIGESKLKIKDYGCLITCLSMLSDWYGKYKDPAWMAKNLSFTKDGLLLWTSIKPPMLFVYRYYKQDDKKIKEILYSKDNACILRVTFYGSQHWVVLVGYSRLRGYRIADPWDGTVKYIPRNYLPITGFAEVTRK